MVIDTDRNTTNERLGIIETRLTRLETSVKVSLAFNIATFLLVLKIALE